MKRYIQIGNYPGNKYDIGYIHTVNEDETDLFESYPLIYRLMSWWEKRKPEELPQYVRLVSGESYFSIGDVLRVADWNYSYKTGWVCVINNTEQFYASNVEPITKQEFDNTPSEHKPSAGY